MKRCLFLVLALALAMWAPIPAQADCPGITQGLFPITSSYQQLTVSNTAVGLTYPTNRNVVLAVVVVEGNDIRFRDDGTSPTASVGTPVLAGLTIPLCGTSISSFKAIRVSGDAVLNVSYYGQ